MSEVLSGRRLWLLVRADFVIGYRSLLVVSGAIAGIILIASIASIASRADSGPGGFSYRECFGWVLFIWGLVASSRAFRPIHDKTRNEAYLLVPASALEKTLARLFAVTAGLTAYLLAFMFLVSVLVETLNLVFFGDRNAFFDPFDRSVGNRVLLYLAVQPLFFLGGAWFRKAHLVKTTLAATVAIAALAAFAALTVRVVLADYRLEIGDVLFVLEQRGREWGIGMETAFCAVAVLMALSCWWIAWLRVSEAQASDGV